MDTATEPELIRDAIRYHMLKFAQHHGLGAAAKVKAELHNLGVRTISDINNEAALVNFYGLMRDLHESVKPVDDLR